MKEKLKNKPPEWDSMFLIGISLAVAFWLIESFLHIFRSPDFTFTQNFLGENLYDIYSRVIVLCLFLIFGSHVQYTINKRKKAENALKEADKKLQEARGATILGLAKLAEYRDTSTGLHLERMREYSKLLAIALSDNPEYKEYITEEYIEDIFNSSILHDIGKVGIPDSILLKPAKLDADEYEIMKNHAQLGGEAIETIESKIKGQSFLSIGKEIAYHHHEKWNGSGYPDGLKGDSIPLSARLIALADVYDALTSKRVYKKPYSHEAAKEMILKDKGKHFAPEVVDAFFAYEDKFKNVCLSMQE